MNKIFLYTIWQRVPDYIENPKLPADFFEGLDGEPDVKTFTVVERNPETGMDEDVIEDVLIIDPRNPRGVRYQAVKCLDNLDVVQNVCAGTNGEYVYTYQEAWFGEPQ